MHLIRIELENFKSFGGEMVIPFDMGFTAITGPNGSGKSNCGDAIQFVLGPKSTKALRASNVSELIFNGGGRGKAAKQMSVTLVFANVPEHGGKRRLRIQEDEVSFTRSVRLNRKGDPISSFRIGDKPSTATEMRRVLSEAGLRGDGYNIVLQGDVTNLATMTPHRRRGVLEEVAGVTAYDDEIRRANNQRKHVENSIETIDLLEVDKKKQLKQLGKEREQALRFRELKEERDKSKVTLYQSRYRNRLDEVKLLGEERSGYTERVGLLDSSITEGNANLVSYDEELVSIEAEIKEVLAGDAQSLIQEIRQHEIDIETGSDRIGDQRRTILESDEEIKVLTEEIRRAREARQEASDALDSANEALSLADDSLRQAAVDENDAREAIQSGDKHARDLNRALGKATDAVSSAQDLHSEAQLEADRASQASQIASENLADLEEKYEEATMVRDDLELIGEDLRESDGEIDRGTLADDYRRLQKQEKELRTDRDRSETRLRDAERNLSKARARQEARSSAPGSALTLAALTKLRESGQISGILGSLGELTSPKEPAHEDALATALGNGLRSIVVRDDEVAAKCIAWLRNNSGGRATFLPLSKLKVSRPQGRTLLVARNPGMIGFAHELLDYDEEVETAVIYASRNTLLVDSMEVARRNMGGVRMVTLDGSLIESSGAMTGGSSSRGNRPSFGGGPSRSSSLDRLERAVEDADLLYSTVDAALREALTNMQDLRDRINNMDGSDHSVKVRNWKADMDRAIKDVKETESKVIAAKTEFDSSEDTRAKKESNANNAQNDLNAAIEARSLAAEALQDNTPDHLSEILRNAEQTRTDAERTRLQSESSITRNQDRLSLMEGRISELDRQLVKHNSAIENAESSIEQLEESISSSRETLKDLKDQSSQFDEEEKILTEKRDLLFEERASLRASLEGLSKERQTIRHRIDELNGQIQQKRDAVGETESELQEAGVEIPSEEVQLPTIAEAERVLQGLERRLGNLGDVNMLAIEQYDATAERIADLVDDGKTLRSRRDNLVSIAEQLESERKLRFMTVFEHVNSNFSRVYEILQPSGSGKLRLENQKNPFEGGLDMACVPPGKSRNTRRSALSGGEKSMAALALIFAIQDYEPSPFYYFDEVDQNLDPFNSGRIATLCRIRSERAQFIMVTLRKVSLSLADHHIGITHAGDGCSRRITDFDRAAAIELSEELEKEEEAQAKSKAELESMPELPKPEDMPKVPEPLGAPKSLGGLAERAGVDVEEEESESSVSPEGSMDSLRERTEDWSEDIEERDQVEFPQEPGETPTSDPENEVLPEAETEAD
ncbi:MAG: chromosome segregation protein SMC [Euryarchaeota archaeon]|nr:chromosome segregation protein SMC [Euryarchaeota archaeon]